MARNQSAAVPATGPAQGTDLASMTAAQKAALLDSLKADAKAQRARERGDVKIAFGEGGVVQLDMVPGTEPAKSKDGRTYLFNVDAVEFTHNGVTYVTGAFWALPKKAK